jgi:alcohol/geraniol dehydrogenase (NADP+)
VVGIGGLGHMALKFLNSWGCEVTALFTTPEKEKESRQFGSHNFFNSRNPDALGSLANKFNMVLVTSNVDLNWDVLSIRFVLDASYILLEQPIKLMSV